MKSPIFKVLSNTAIIAALLAMLCSVVTARNYARIVAPQISSHYYNRPFHDPLDMISEMIRTPMFFNSMTSLSQVDLKPHVERPVPRYTVSEDNGIVWLEMEVPGVLAKDIAVDLEDDKLLRIKGVRTYKRSDGSVDQSEFDVALQLKDNLDTSQLKANLVAGILRVQVPNKVKEVKRISIGNDGTDTDDDTVVVSYKNENETEKASSTSSDDTANLEVDGITISSETDE